MPPSPEQRLCQAMLIQALTDITRANRHAKEAKRWVIKGYRTFRICAFGLNITEQDLKIKMLLRLKEDRPICRLPYV